MTLSFKPAGVMLVEDIDCQACKGTGYEPGHEPTEPGVAYRWCSTCQGQKVRHRLVSLEEFAKLFLVQASSPFPSRLETKEAYDVRMARYDEIARQRREAER